MEFEEIEEKRKLEEQRQLHYQYCKEENKPMVDTEGRPLDVNNRNKYFEPSSNNPIPSSGIKRAGGKVYDSAPIQDPRAQPSNYHQNHPQVMEGNTTNPSTINQPNEIQYPSGPSVDNKGFMPATQMHQNQHIQPQYPSENPDQQINPGMGFSNQPPVMNQPQMNVQSPSNMNQQDPSNMNIVIEEQKKVIEMYQNSLQQLIEFQKVVAETKQDIDKAKKGIILF